MSPVPFSDVRNQGTQDQVARFFAEDWCAQNPGFEYTGNWSNNHGQSYFTVRNIVNA